MPAPLVVDWDEPEQSSALVVRPQPYIARTLPHSLEAEEHLLSCCLLDGASTLTACIDTGLTPASFYDTKHGIVFEILLELHRDNTPIDVAVLAEELKSRRLLDQVGGYAFLTQVSSGVPTTAQAPFFISKVREQSLLREAIRRSTRFVEDAYNFTGDIDRFLEEISKPLRELTPRRVVVENRPPSAFSIPPDNDESTLLGNRYLSRGDGAVLSSTSGMGKSSLSLQLATLWALGRPAFGIRPPKPLKSLIIQSEDSDGDVAEVWHSIKHSLQLTATEIAQVDQNVAIVCDRVSRGLTFHKQLQTHLAALTPDLVWINPLQAFLDGDITDSQDLGRFLREQLNALNTPPSFAYILVHHTTKPATGKNRDERQWHEVMYDMAGGAELINWARAILSLRPATNEGEFNLILAKRGRRAGVTKMVEQGAGLREEPSTVIPLRHAKGHIEVPGRAKPLPIIFWEERDHDSPASKTPDTSKGGRPPKHDFSDYRSVFPPHASQGLDLSQLHRALSTNRPISKTTLHDCLKRWENEGAVETISQPQKPLRYRASKFLEQQ